MTDAFTHTPLAFKPVVRSEPAAILSKLKKRKRRPGPNPPGPERPSSPKPDPVQAAKRPVSDRTSAASAVSALTNPRRQWLWRIAALALAPLLLAALEAGLRLAGYGYPTHFFKKTSIGGRDFYVENDKFGWRFFPQELARSPPPVAMSAAKATNTYRIFLLGESAAMGDPAPAYGAGRYLEVLLNERFPDRQFEVICVAMTAINSHGILPIARECARHEGDLWIIYMGNNEMTGPFGAATIFGLKAPSLSIVRLSLAIQRTRVGQLLLSLGQRLKGNSSRASSWHGMKMFMENTVPPEDPRREVVYQNFRRNLQDILRTGLGSGAKIILNTVAVNLKDCAPFASMLDASLPAPKRKECQELCLSGSQAENQGRFADAVANYDLAANQGPHFAEVQFRLADCLLRLTNHAEAGRHFELARDCDALPFRATSRINRVTTELSHEFAAPDLVLFDAVSMVASNSPVGVSGRESFYEHAHFNFDGNYHLARAWAEQVEHFLPASIQRRATTDWASQESCERLLGLTDWNRYEVVKNVLDRVLEAPFTNQIHHAAREEHLAGQLAEIRQRLQPRAYRQARSVYHEALSKRPQDHWLHQTFAEFLEATGDLPRAAAEWEKVRELLPHHHAAYFQAGRLLSAQGKLAEAQPRLHQALALRPDLSAGWFELGKVHAAEGNAQLALQEFERAQRLVPENYHVYYQMGKALSKLGRRAEAIAMFRHALQAGPKNNWEGHYALGEELAFNGQTAEARNEFEEVLRLKPNVAMAHLNLGVALVNQGFLDDAIPHFEEVMRLDPRNKLAPDYLAKVRARKGLASHAPSPSPAKSPAALQPPAKFQTPTPSGDSNATNQ